MSSQPNTFLAGAFLFHLTPIRCIKESSPTLGRRRPEWLRRRRWRCIVSAACGMATEASLRHKLDPGVAAGSGCTQRQELLETLDGYTLVT